MSLHRLREGKISLHDDDDNVIKTDDDIDL